MAVKKAMQLFDSLIRPIFLYAVEFWLPHIIPKKGLENCECLLKFWTNFQPEILNQKLCRMLLGVHKKCSILAVPGELGRYPVLIPALKMCLKYQHSVSSLDSNSLAYRAMSDMRSNPNEDSWYTRVEKIKTVLNLKRFYGKTEIVGNQIDLALKSKFDRFFLDQINEKKFGLDGMDHNKLRLYNTLKGSFKQEPYINNIKSRNQRVWLTRYRTSAHNLRVESGRYTYPVTPLLQRTCSYCNSGECDTELHAMLQCETFKLKRQCFQSRVSAFFPTYPYLTVEQQLATILCPSTTDLAKCVSKYFGIISNARKQIDLGFKKEDLQLYIQHKV